VATRAVCALNKLLHLRRLLAEQRTKFVTPSLVDVELRLVDLLCSTPTYDGRMHHNAGRCSAHDAPPTIATTDTAQRPWPITGTL
jgi:hypothetical protein